MKWTILADSGQRSADSNDKITELLLKNRGLKTKREIAEFLTPPDPYLLTANRLGLESKQLSKATKRIYQAIKKAEPIIIYGDYDADGICATAIVWEALRDLGAKALPFIPKREKEGYGLSKEGIDAILGNEKYNMSYKSNKTNMSNGLIITVDSGIVAHEAVDFAKKKKLDVIIIDHHEKPKKLPKALAIIHTPKLCAAGICFFFAKDLRNMYVTYDGRHMQPTSSQEQETGALELATIATVTDLMPLVGPNRSIVKYGLELLNKTTRPGLRALFNVAGLEKIGTYEIGFMIGPRLNASGRIESALTALRLLCTADFSKAQQYAQLLNETNKERQTMTEEMTTHALEQSAVSSKRSEKILVVEHESYHQGVIGLIAGKLVEKYYLPAIVIAKGKEVSKASARSISGFNIIEAIRASEQILVNAGGHPMAAGFTIETTKIEEFKKRITQAASKDITDSMLERQLQIDCLLELSMIDWNFYQDISKFAPFGLGNPEPTFASRVEVVDLRLVGNGKHLKLTIKDDDRGFDAIAFNQGELFGKVKSGEKVQIAYTISPDSYNGNQRLQLKVKDIMIDTIL